MGIETYHTMRSLNKMLNNHLKPLGYEFEMAVMCESSGILMYCSNISIPDLYVKREWSRRDMNMNKGYVVARRLQRMVSILEARKKRLYPNPTILTNKNKRRLDKYRKV